MSDTTNPLFQTDQSFIVGAVGHRNLAEMKESIGRKIEFVLRQLIANHPNEHVSLVCSVAEGADRLLLAASIELGMPHDLVLPCSPNCFRGDFHSSVSREEFDRFLQGARSIVQPAAPIDKESGYLWASEAILAHAHILIAVWDGKPGHGPAGTAETVSRSLQRGIPVIWIPTVPPHDFKTLVPGGEILV